MRSYEKIPNTAPTVALARNSSTIRSGLESGVSRLRVDDCTDAFAPKRTYVGPRPRRAGARPRRRSLQARNRVLVELTICKTLLPFADHSSISGSTYNRCVDALRDTQLISETRCRRRRQKVHRRSHLLYCVVAARSVAWPTRSRLPVSHRAVIVMLETFQFPFTLIRS